MKMQQEGGKAGREQNNNVSFSFLLAFPSSCDFGMAGGC
jgi:hypothetical protein